MLPEWRDFDDITDRKLLTLLFNSFAATPLFKNGQSRTLKFAVLIECRAFNKYIERANWTLFYLKFNAESEKISFNPKIGREVPQNGVQSCDVKNTSIHVIRTQRVKKMLLIFFFFFF